VAERLERSGCRGTETEPPAATPPVRAVKVQQRRRLVVRLGHLARLVRPRLSGQA
jgi:hypothetical protein